MKFYFLILVLFCSNLLFPKEEMTRVLEGTVSYISSQNIYVKFKSTEGIEAGDTLFIKEKNNYLPAIKIDYTSSTSCAGVSITNKKIELNTLVYAFIFDEVNDTTATETEITEAAVILPAVIPAVTSAEIETKTSLVPVPTTSGRVSIQSYSNFTNQSTRFDYQRWRYTFQLNANRIGGSGFTYTQYLSFAYRASDWNYISSNLEDRKDLLLSDDDDNIPSIRKLSPHFIPKVLTNSASGRLSLEFGLKGPNLATSTACAAGTHAIGDGFRAIQYGTIDLCLAGGSEASIEPIGLAGFCRLRALSTNTIPEISSRPFDIARDGFVMGEGAAMLVLEELEHAKVRGATILAEISGYGMSGDAFHITAPDEEGIGAERAMKMALEDAQNNRNDMENPLKVGYVNAHATSTPKGDEIEAMVIDRVLRNSLDSNDENSLITPYVSSIKGATGHLLGAAGALEAALTVMSIVHQRIPPTLNLEQVDWNGNEESRCCFEHVRGDAITPAAKLKAAISNSFGFGGTNASLLFCKYEDDGDGHI